MGNIAHYFQTLEIEPEATQAEIKQAYRDLILVWHPDRFCDNPRLRQKAEVKIKKINAAYEFLKSHQPQVTQAEAAPAPKHKQPVEPRINCEKLQQLLELKKWKDADLETKRLLLELMHREKDGWLQPDDIKNLSPQSLLAIDRLWTQHSDGYFGFSVQSKIWHSLGCKSSPEVSVQTMSENRFGKAVYWYVNNMWLSPWDAFNYEAQNVKGSLPREYIFALSGWRSYTKGWTGYMLWRFDEIFLKLI
ncbi:GUN4 domain-containing protein [Phormidesmis sp. 146-33]